MAGQPGSGRVEAAATLDSHTAREWHNHRGVFIFSVQAAPPRSSDNLLLGDSVERTYTRRCCQSPGRRKWKGEEARSGFFHARLWVRCPRALEPLIGLLTSPHRRRPHDLLAPTATRTFAGI